MRPEVFHEMGLQATQNGVKEEKNEKWRNIEWAALQDGFR